MLELRDVAAGHGETVVIRGVSLAVERGRALALLGRNGVGKTTLLSALMGLLPPLGGVVALDGRDITRWPPHRRARAGLGYVPQGRGIFPHLTVRENLLLGLEAALPLRGADTGSGREAGAASRRREAEVALEEAMALLPGLRPLLGRRAGFLSGGQQQQLAIARALAARPRYLLLDEPTEGLQPSLVDETAELLSALKERGETGIFLAEQRLDFALRVADDFAVLDAGVVVARGAVCELDARALLQHLAV